MSSKGVSETFDEHEQDTAQRGYPQPLLDTAKRTAQIAKFDLESLRLASGTHPTVTSDAIEQHQQKSKLEAPTLPAAISVSTAIDHEVRRRIEDAFVVEAPVLAPPASSAMTTAPVSAPTPIAARAPAEASSPPSSTQGEATPASRISFSRGAFAFLVLLVLALVAGAGAAGFQLGRGRR